MRSVPVNPVTGQPLFHFPSDNEARRTAILLGGATGALVGGAIWGLTRQTVGRVGLLFPIAGTVAGMLAWSPMGVPAVR